LFQVVTHGFLLDVAFLLTVSFVLGDDDSVSDKTYDLDEEKRDEGDM
jgi:thiamine pyrophosphokinase